MHAHHVASSILAQQLLQQARVGPQILPFTSPFPQPQQVPRCDCAPNTSFSQGRPNLQEARATRSWKAVRVGGHVIACVRKVAWDAWARPRLHGWGCHVSEADIIWGGSVGKESEHPSGFISNLFWVTDEWRPKAGWPGFLCPLAAERWRGEGGSQWCSGFVILHSAADKRQSTPPPSVSLCPPRPSLTPLQKDSVGKRKGVKCCSWQGPRGSTMPLLASSLQERTFVFFLTS